eukprot:7935759-Heterocapsa_arctica.AAC.1
MPHMPGKEEHNWLHKHNIRDGQQPGPGAMEQYGEEPRVQELDNPGEGGRAVCYADEPGSTRQETSEQDGGSKDTEGEVSGLPKVERCHTVHLADHDELQNRSTGEQTGIHRVQGHGKCKVQRGPGQVCAITEAGKRKSGRPYGVHDGNGFPVPDREMRQ